MDKLDKVTVINDEVRDIEFLQTLPQSNKREWTMRICFRNVPSVVLKMNHKNIAQLFAILKCGFSKHDLDWE